MKKLLLLTVLMIGYFHSFAYVTQGNWRWRNNDGNEKSATWLAGQNKPITVSSIDNILRLRIQIDNTTGDPKSLNANLQYASAPDGPWRYITNLKGNNAFTFSNSNAFVSDLTNTTRQLTGSVNAFFPGKLFVKTNELDVPFANATNSEFEYSIQPTDNIDPNTTYYFRIPNADYPQGYPSLTTSKNINSKRKFLTNGSFESELNEWAFKVSQGASATASTTENARKDGLRSLAVKVEQTAGQTAIRLSHKPVSLQTGKAYLVRFWAYSEKNGAKLLLGLKGRKALPYNFKLHTSWQEYQFAFKAAEPKAGLHFLFQTPTTYFIDKVEILDENNEEVDVAMNYMWQNRRSPKEYGWLSADGENSERLPDGRVVWNFSDGWYGYNDTTTNSMKTQQLLRNTFVTQSAPKPDGELHTIMGGTVDQPLALMNPPDKRGHDNFFWPRDMTVENDSLKILLPEVIQWKENDPLTDGLRQAVGVFSLPDLKLQSIEWMPWLDSIKTYYIAFCKADDGYTYVYGGNRLSDFEIETHVARFPTGKLSATYPWEFFTGTAWDKDPKKSKAIANVQLYCVTKLGYNNYVSLFMNPVSDKIEVMYAESPVGPWVARSIVGQIEGQSGILAYFALLHEETENNGVYTFSYSNIGDIPQMLNDKTVYWPSYLKADLKSLSPFNNNTMPAEKVEFSATQKAEKVSLQWKWEAVTKANQFDVEKSADGRANWTKIGEISAVKSDTRKSYELTDNNPFTGNNYYRLKRTDISGSSTYSQVKMVNIMTSLVSVFPNPTNGRVNLMINSKIDENVTAVLTDLKGRIVYREIISVLKTGGSYRLNINRKLSSGLYILQLKGKDLNEKIKLEIQ